MSYQKEKKMKILLNRKIINEEQNMHNFQYFHKINNRILQKKKIDQIATLFYSDFLLALQLTEIET
jgi:hypothetical protein